MPPATQLRLDTQTCGVLKQIGKSRMLLREGLPAGVLLLLAEAHDATLRNIGIGGSGGTAAAAAARCISQLYLLLLVLLLVLLLRRCQGAGMPAVR